MNTVMRILVWKLGVLCCILAAASPSIATESRAPVTAIPRDGEGVAVRAWLVSDPFPSPTMLARSGRDPMRVGYNTDYLEAIGGETGARITPQTTLTLPDGRQAGFTARTWEQDYIDLTHVFGRMAEVVVYLYAEIESPANQDVYLHFGVNDAGKVWVNGECIITHPNDGGAIRSAETARVRLRRGRNALLVKADQAGANWGVYVDVYGKTIHERVLATCNPRGVRRALAPFRRLQSEIGDPSALTGARRDAYSHALFMAEHVIRDAGTGDGSQQWRPERFLVPEYTDRLRAAVEDFRRGVDPYGGRTGQYEATYLCNADLTAQPFTVIVPETYSSDRQYPLLVDIHGAGGTHECGNWWLGTTEMDTSLKEDIIVLVPLGRGRWGQYEGLAEDDVLQGIQWVKDHYSVDADRVYLIGGSMGGGGTWKLTARHPDVFAAGWSDCGWASMRTLPSLLNVPLYVAHGTADWVVSILGSRLGVREMQRLGSPVVYTEYPGVDHGVGHVSRANGATNRLFTHRRVADPARIRIAAEHPRQSEQYWGHIVEWTNPHEVALMEAAILPGNTVSVTLGNVQKATLAPPARHLEESGDLVWMVAGRHVVSPRSPSGRYEITVGDSTVSVAAYSEQPEPAVRPYMSGSTMNLYYGEPFTVVYGTMPRDRALRDAIRKAAETIAGRSKPECDNEFGQAPVVADRDLTDEQAATRNLFLVGGAAENSVSARLMPRMAVREESGALRSYDAEPIPLDGRGYTFIQPNPEHPQRFVIVYGSRVQQWYSFRPSPLMSWDATDDPLRNPDLDVWNVARVDSMNDVRQNTLVHREFFTNDWQPLRLPDGRFTRFPTDAAAAEALVAQAKRQAAGADFYLYGYEPSGLLWIDTTTVTAADLSLAFGGGLTAVFDITGEDLVRIMRVGGERFTYAEPQVDTTAIDRGRVYRVAGSEWLHWEISRSCQHNLANYELTDLSIPIERYLRRTWGVVEE